MTQKKLALIDGYGFVFRAFHSLPPLTRGDGIQVGAVYGFTNMLIKLLAGLHVSHVAVVFDSGSKTFRNEIYPEYKAHRPPCPEELIPQFPIVREAAESLNLAILEKIGFEADDIIATLAKKYSKEDYEVLIISSDKDLMQLIDGNVKMYDAMRNKLIAENEVKEKFFVAPNKVLDVLSLIGDSSDNVPGVRGIGPKTAAELINQFGSLENIFSNLDQIKQDKRREMLREGEEKAKLSKILVSLKEDVELPVTQNDLEVKAIDPHKLLVFLQKQGFRSLIERVKKEFQITETASASANVSESPALKNVLSENKKPTISFAQIKKTEISSKEELKKLHEQIDKNGLAIFDFQENGEEILNLSISTTKNNEDLTEIFFISLKKDESAPSADLFGFDNVQKTSEISLSDIDKIISDESIKKIFFDLKLFLRILFFTNKPNKNFPISSFEDVSLINHLLNCSVKNELRELINLNLEEDLGALDFGKYFNELDKSRLPEFETNDKKIEFYTFRNFAIYNLYKILAPKIAELKLSGSYQNQEKPLLLTLAKIESEGVKLDTHKLHLLSQEFAKEIDRLSKEIYQIAGQEFNIASPKQLGEILFEKMNLTSSKKSKKTGALSTGVEVLEELAEQGFEIAQKILDFRKFSKLKNTYTDSLPEEINKSTGRVHTTLSSISTITGRLSSYNPNLQNIPIKTKEGKKIRECIIAKEGSLLIAADYSQIELRILAGVANIENLIQAFKENKDIHRITAAQVFGLKEEDVNDDIRSKAKAINFGIIYGISGFGLARQLGISRTEASDYIKSYFAAYPGIQASMKKFIDEAKQNGYIETIGGRKCFISHINDKNPMIRAEAERLAINAPIQGSAADVIKKAMIRLDKKLMEKNFDAKIILQIHDELIIEAKESEAEEVAKVVREEMENAFSFSVPLKVDLDIAKEWK